MTKNVQLGHCFNVLSFREAEVVVKLGRKADNLKCDHCNVVFKVILLIA